MAGKQTVDGIEPRRHFDGGCSTDGADPELVAALGRRILRPLRERAKIAGYAVAVHGSLIRDIDLVAVPWTESAWAPEKLANSLKQVLSKMYPIELEVPPNAERPRPHGRLCWSWWIRRWTYVDLSIFPPVAAPPPENSADDGALAPQAAGSGGQP